MKIAAIIILTLTCLSANAENNDKAYSHDPTWRDATNRIAAIKTKLEKSYAERQKLEEVRSYKIKLIQKVASEDAAIEKLKKEEAALDIQNDSENLKRLKAETRIDEALKKVAPKLAPKK